ncbi:hypothetical protein BGZ63DRAFT_360329, partial [Mariannaea sp. PMI_226]
ILKELGILVANLWNFDKMPLQLGWVKNTVRVFSTYMKKNSRSVVFQLGNKETLISVDTISAGGRAIPSFLILIAKVLLEEYAITDINEEVIITNTASGFTNSQQAL